MSKSININNELILGIMNANVNISNIQNINSDKSFKGKAYDYIYSFDFYINGTMIPISLAIPQNWNVNLIDMYINNLDIIPYIPHVDTYGKLCLFDLEGILVEWNFIGLLNQVLDKAYQVLSEGLNGFNRNDFIKEFEVYWGQLDSSKILKSMVTISKEVKLVSFSKVIKDKKKNSKIPYVDRLNNDNNYHIIAADFTEDIMNYKHVEEIRNGIYIPIEIEEYIYPPDWRIKLNLDYINALIKLSNVNSNKLRKLLKKCGSKLLLIFAINQPNGHINSLSVIIDYPMIIEESDIHIVKYRSITPLRVFRNDKDFLVNRGCATSSLRYKKILVIGCGSIGGCLINEIVRSGVDDLTIVDDDLLSEENIYRHLLGMKYVWQYKTIALADFLKQNVPNTNLKTIEDKIENLLSDGDIDLRDYDLILSAVGNHNVNRWINSFMYSTGVDKPIIYLWNEVLGIGNHAAFIKVGFDGCYNCFFGESDNGIYDKTSYCEAGQVFAKNLSGCGSAYMPFSSIHSLKTVTVGIELMKRYFEGRINNNIIISLKGDSYYLSKEGFSLSDKYKNQSSERVEIEGFKFKNRNCDCCGG